MTVLASDHFDINGSLSANWTNMDVYGTPAPQVINQMVDGNGNNCGAFYSGITWPNDQYSQIKVIAGRCLPGVRITNVGGGGSSGYLVSYSHLGTADIDIMKFVFGTGYTLLGSDPNYVPAANDVIYLSAYGNELVLKVNGLTRVIVNDNELTSGNSGIFRMGLDNPDRGDDWEGGSVLTSIRGTRLRFLNNILP